MANMNLETSASLNVASGDNEKKPVIVRVKRKQHHSPLDAFWLGIKERPWKRQALDFENLSLDYNYSKKTCHGEPKLKKFVVTHFDTAPESKEVFDVVQEFMLKPNDSAEPTTRFAERKLDYKRQSQLNIGSSKSKQNHEQLSRGFRLEQIWRNRTKFECLGNVCHFYDVVRLDDGDEYSSKAQEEFLSNYYPSLRGRFPKSDSESDSDESHSSSDDYVYDYYSLKEGVEMPSSLPMVELEAYDWFEDDEESERDSYDSNAECHPFNEYPDEPTEEDSDTDDDDDVDCPDEENEDSVEDGSNDENCGVCGDYGLEPFADASEDEDYDGLDQFDPYDSERDDFY